MLSLVRSCTGNLSVLLADELGPDLPLADAPKPFLTMLVQQHLNGDDRMALFQSSKAMASVVLQYSPDVTLTPAADPPGHLSRVSSMRSVLSRRSRGAGPARSGCCGLFSFMHAWRQPSIAATRRIASQSVSGKPTRSSSSASFTIRNAASSAAISGDRWDTLCSLAAPCSDLHISMHGCSLPLSEELLTHVTQLSLHDVPLSRETIWQHLQLQHLTQLHTLRLVTHAGSGMPLPEGQPSGLVDQAALREVLAVGSLSALRTLGCEGPDLGEVRSLLTDLAAVMGHQIQHLIIDQMEALAVLPSFPTLTRLELRVPPADGSQHQDSVTFMPLDAANALFNHHSLSDITMPSSFAFHTDFTATQSCNAWQTLHLTTPAKWSFLAALPLRGVKRLRIDGGIQFGFHGDYKENALHNLTHCSQVLCVPVLGSRQATKMGLPADVPLFSLSCYSLQPQDLAMCAHGLTGALALCSCELVQVEQLAALMGEVPETVHTLCLIELHASCSWQHVFKLVPPHIKHLVLHHCECGSQLMHVFEVRSPALTAVTVSPLMWGAGERRVWLSRNRAAVDAAAAQAGVTFRVVDVKPAP